MRRKQQKKIRGWVSRKLPRIIRRTAQRKLLYLHDADDIEDLRAPPGNRLEKVNTVFGPTSSGEFVLNGLTARHMILRL